MIWVYNMVTQNWQLQTPVSAIVFDCDGTLSALEGVDELAKNNGVSEKVSALTAQAMGVSGLNPQLYQERLHLIYPHQKQVFALGHQYFKHQVPDAESVISVLHRMNKSIYVVSAGLYPAVTIFAELLQIPRSNIFAVDVHFDQEGNFLDFDRTSPLIHNLGKRSVVSQLKSLHQSIIHIGDGLNDFVTQDLVTRFIGYGGVFYRENLAARCEYYIGTASISPLLPLALTQEEYTKLMPAEQKLYLQGLVAIQEGKVLVAAR